MRKKLILVGTISLIIVLIAYIVISNYLADSEVERYHLLWQVESVETDRETMAEGSLCPNIIFADENEQLKELRSYQGEKAVILNFWATWCGPCRQEKSVMQEVYKQNQEDIIVIAVNLQDDKEAVNEYLAGEDFSFPVLLDTEGVAANSLGVINLPTTVFVDIKGIIIKIYRREINEDNIENFIDSLT